MPQIYLIRRMHYLASRFIRVKNKNVNELHVIDPYLDFRQRFENLEKLKDMLRLRKICNHEMHVEEIAANYNRWWDSFRTYENNSDDHLKEKLRSKLLENSDGLMKALALPNDLDEIEDFTDTLLTGKTNILNNYGIFSSQKQLKSLTIQKFPNSVLLVPHFMVRPALLSICNVKLENFPLVQDGSNPNMVLVGVSLPSMLSSLIRQCFSLSSNKWPITLMAAGNKYKRSDNPLIEKEFEKTTVFSILNLYKTKDEFISIKNSLEHLCQQYCSLFGPTIRDCLDPEKLEMFERSAILYKCSNVDSLKQRNLVRIAHIGDYLSKRGNICYEDKRNLEFLKMFYTEFTLKCSYD